MKKNCLSGVVEIRRCNDDRKVFRKDQTELLSR